MHLDNKKLPLLVPLLEPVHPHDAIQGGHGIYCLVGRRFNIRHLTEPDRWPTIRLSAFCGREWRKMLLPTRFTLTNTT